MTTTQDWQATSRAHFAYAEAHPEWMQMALIAVNVWGSKGKTLPHAIGELLQEAYAMGQRGEPPVYAPPDAVTKVVRRSRNATAPEELPPQRVQRRTRPEAPQEAPKRYVRSRK